MKTILLVPLVLGTTLALGACANKAETAADTAPVAADAAASAGAATPATTAPATQPEGTSAEAATAATDAMAGMSAEQHAAMDAANAAHGDGDDDGHGDAHGATGATGAAANGGMSTSTQAGWYSAGTFRACGSSKAMKVDKPAEIDAQIKKGGMSASDPVYVQVEGMAMGEGYMLTRVVQVGSKTPVRDCPMTGTTTQVGG